MRVCAGMCKRAYLGLHRWVNREENPLCSGWKYRPAQLHALATFGLSCYLELCNLRMPIGQGLLTINMVPFHINASSEIRNYQPRTHPPPLFIASLHCFSGSFIDIPSLTPYDVDDYDRNQNQPLHPSCHISSGTACKTAYLTPAGTLCHSLLPPPHPLPVHGL